MTNLVKTWILGEDRILRTLGGRTTGGPPPHGMGQILKVTSIQFGSAPPPLPGGYDHTVWRFGNLGSYEPGPSTTGVPSDVTLTALTPSDVGTLSGNIITISADNVVIDGKYIPYYLKVTGNNCRITRCEIVGGSSWVGAESALVDYRSMNQVGLVVADCTLHQAVPSLYINAGIGHHATFDRCHIYHCVDGFGIYNNNAAINPTTGETHKNDGDMLIRGNYGHDYSFFTPDPTHSDNITHNDFVQFHGGKRSQVIGNCINWFAAPAPIGNGSAFVGSAAAGVDATATANRGYGQGVLISPIIASPQDNIVKWNWFHGTGGQCVIRTTTPNYVGENRFDLTGKKFTTSGSRYEIRTNVSLLGAIDGLYSNVWNDTGAFLTYDSANPANGTGGIRADAG